MARHTPSRGVVCAVFVVRGRGLLGVTLPTRSRIRQGIPAPIWSGKWGSVRQVVKILSDRLAFGWSGWVGGGGRNSM